MTNRLTCIVVLVPLAAVAVSAQTSWSTHTRAGEYAFARADFARAESEFQSALEIAKAFPEGDRRLETSLSNLARLYENRSDYDRAQPMYQLLLAAQEHRLGVDDPGLLDTLYAVARSSQPTGDLPTVTESLRRYAEIADASGAAPPRRHWQALDMLARMEVVQENEEQALIWQLRAVEVIAEDSQADEAERATVLQSAANLALTTGEGDQAESLLRQVSELRSAGDGVDQTALIMATGAATAYGAGQFDAAERVATRGLEAAPDPAVEQLLRKTLAEVSWARVNRGTDDLEVLLAAAGSDPALDTARDRLRDLVETENGENPQTLRHLVQVEALRGQPAAAVIWQRRLIELGSMMDISTLGARADLVTLLAASGDSETALAENAVAIEDVEEHYGPASAHLVSLLEQRAVVATAAGNKREAKKAQKRLRKLSH